MGKKAPTRKASRGFRGRSHGKQVKPLVLLAVEGATEKSISRRSISTVIGEHLLLISAGVVTNPRSRISW